MGPSYQFRPQRAVVPLNGVGLEFVLSVLFRCTWFYFVSPFPFQSCAISSSAPHYSRRTLLTTINIPTHNDTSFFYGLRFLALSAQAGCARYPIGLHLSSCSVFLRTISLVQVCSPAMLCHDPLACFPVTGDRYGGLSPF